MNIPFMRGGTPKKLRLFTRFIDAIVQLSYQSLFLVWLLLAVVIGGLYFILSFVPGEGPVQLTNIDGTWSRFWNSIYFSFVTVTSTGYGDITPMGASKLLAIFQSILALLVFAVLVTKLVSKQQDVALQQIHKLVFEDVFHNIREGFYIVRKDFDRIIHTAEHGVALTEHNWEDLQTAYRQAQSFLRRIPDFYMRLMCGERSYSTMVCIARLRASNISSTFLRRRIFPGFMKMRALRSFGNFSSSWMSQ